MLLQSTAILQQPATSLNEALLKGKTKGSHFSNSIWANVTRTYFATLDGLNRFKNHLSESSHNKLGIKSCFQQVSVYWQALLESDIYTIKHLS